MNIINEARIEQSLTKKVFKLFREHSLVLSRLEAYFGVTIEDGGQLFDFFDNLDHYTKVLERTNLVAYKDFDEFFNSDDCFVLRAVITDYANLLSHRLRLHDFKVLVLDAENNLLMHVGMDLPALERTGLIDSWKESIKSVLSDPENVKPIEKQFEASITKTEGFLYIAERLLPKEKRGEFLAMFDYYEEDNS